MLSRFLRAALCAAVLCGPGVTAQAPDFAVSQTIKVSRAPHGMVKHENRLYVANAGADTIGVVDLSTGQQVATQPAPDGVPLDIMRSQRNTWLVTAFRGTTITELNDAWELIARYEVGKSPSLFTAGPADGPVSVTSEFADHLALLNLETGAVETRPTGKQPYPGHLTKDGVLAFVPNRADGTVTVYDLLNNRLAATVTACSKPEGGALTQDEVSYMVACGGDNKVLFINTASFEVTGEISQGIGTRPFSVVAGPDGRYAFVNNAGGETVSVIDLASNTVVQQIPVGQQPIVMRIFDRVLYVANEVSDDISVIPLGPAPQTSGDTPNEVIMLGMIHGRHTDSKLYSLDRLARVFRAIDPDVVLTEIPPNRLDRALSDWTAYGEIREPRVKRFPEYIGMLFPLSDGLEFQIIATAGWNSHMNDYRRQALERLSEDPARASDWAAHQAALAEMNAALDAGGDDPLFIHSAAYDAAVKAGYGGPYDTAFNDDLGTGGWTTINRAHYANIEAALDRLSGQGKRILITYGAGHKYWFLEQLRQRSDITLIDPNPFFKAHPAETE